MPNIRAVPIFHRANRLIHAYEYAQDCDNPVRSALEDAAQRGICLRGASLRGLDLRNAQLAGIDLRGADLQGARLDNANLEGAGLEAADLRDASLASASLIRARITDANLSRAVLRCADLCEAVLTASALHRTDLSLAVLVGATLTRANVSHAILRSADLRGARALDATFAHADLSGASLLGADLRHARLVRAILFGALLEDANLGDANLSGAVLVDATLRDARLVRAHLQDAIVRTTSDLRGSLAHHGSNGDLRDVIFLEDECAHRRPPLCPDQARALAYRERNPDVPVVSRLDERICELLDRGGASVEDTTGSIPSRVHAPREIAGVEIRTREGWAVHLAGEAGADLERKLGTGIAGAMIYMASVGDCPLLGTSDAVIQDLRRSARGPGCDFEHDLI